MNIIRCPFCKSRRVYEAWEGMLYFPVNARKRRGLSHSSATMQRGYSCGKCGEDFPEVSQ